VILAPGFPLLPLPPSVLIGNQRSTTQRVRKHFLRVILILLSTLGTSPVRRTATNQRTTSLVFSELNGSDRHHPSESQ
jgi:hypothetical protein